MLYRYAIGTTILFSLYHHAFVEKHPGVNYAHPKGCGLVMHRSNR